MTGGGLSSSAKAAASRVRHQSCNASMGWRQNVTAGVGKPSLISPWQRPWMHSKKNDSRLRPGKLSNPGCEGCGPNLGGVPLHVRQKIMALPPVPQWMHSFLGDNVSELDVDWDPEPMCTAFLGRCQEWCKSGGLKQPAKQNQLWVVVGTDGGPHTVKGSRHKNGS